MTILFLGSSVIFAFARTRGNQSIGLVARRHFIAVWCVAHLVRGLAASTELFVCSGEHCPGDWACRLVRIFGDVPYFAAYLLFVLFLGHLAKTAQGLASNLFLVWGLGSGFVVSLMVSLAFFAPSGSLYTLSAAYVITLGLLVRNATSLLRVIKPSSFLVPSRLIPLLTRLCWLTGIVFLCQALHFSAAQFLPVQKCERICIFDFTTALLFQLLPTYLAMIYLHAFKFDEAGSPPKTYLTLPQQPL